MKQPDEITLAQGNGGQGMQQLIEGLFLKAFDNPLLNEKEDQARIALADLTAQGDRLAFSTDSYVIDPIIFPGGNIGKLSVCGTANDLSVGGAVPRYLSCGFILEEGLAFETLETLVMAMAKAAQEAGIQIVTGDTKVVPRGAADKIIVSGTIGDHGATILNLRENLGLEADLQSDCAVLEPMIAPLRQIDGIRALRDATRGGVTAILHEFSQACGCGMNVYENKLPMKQSVRGVCELLGLEALNFANEGKIVLVVSPQAEKQVLEALHQHTLGQDACTIGEVTEERYIRLTGIFGTSRILDLPYNEPLPRIC